METCVSQEKKKKKSKVSSTSLHPPKEEEVKIPHKDISSKKKFRKLMKKSIHILAIKNTSLKLIFKKEKWTEVVVCFF